MKPKKAFEKLKELYGDLSQITQGPLGSGSIVLNFSDGTHSRIPTPDIDWETCTKYKPPVWRKVNWPEDKGKKARFRDHVSGCSSPWLEGSLVSVETIYVVDSGTSWNDCEVLDES